MMDAKNYNAHQLWYGVFTPLHLTRLTMEWQRKYGLVIDGKFGSLTRQSVESEMGGFDDTPPTLPSISVPSDQQSDGPPWPPFEGPVPFLPTSRTQVYQMFGNPGTVEKPEKAWQKDNIITVRDLPGVPHKWHFQCHKLAEPYLREGLRRASLTSGYKIERAGGYVLRHIQHNRSNPLSLHSWGIAVDFDPKRNFSRRFELGKAPMPWSDEWKKIWSEGVDEALVMALESVGFTWGGVWGRSQGDLDARAQRASYIDPMHFELRIRS